MKGIGLNRNSIKENVQTDNQHVKRCWNHQSLDKYKWKPEWVSLCPLGRLLANKQNDQCLSLRRYRNWNVCAGQVVTQRGSVTRENSVEVWEKLQTELLWPAIPPPDTHPEQSRPDMTVPLWPPSSAEFPRQPREDTVRTSTTRMNAWGKWGAHTMDHSSIYREEKISSCTTPRSQSENITETEITSHKEADMPWFHMWSI